MKSKVCIVIPARLGSSRLSEKALADIGGKPMIERVFERASLVKGVDLVLVATDHEKILSAARNFGATAVMTPPALQSGTDRVAFVAENSPEASGFGVFVNVQGDEPMMDPEAVEGALELVMSGRFSMATPAAPLSGEADLRNPNVVKVLVDAGDRAVYFSRYPIPYSRGAVPAETAGLAPRHHLGVYAYAREALLGFSKLPRSPWEAAESLEQLRALYHGVPIGVSRARRASIGVDTAEDLELVRSML